MMCRCGHNRSWHRYAWDKFRQVWDTSCEATNYHGPAGHERCRCSKYQDKEDE
ncbi:hypothetical protein SEA_KENUHA5_58 [Mycobacterium phage Kenuha5]|nr:hypothetical protein SEA_KENUHA5_58 [Mycobacterium phage Kenuha5]